MRQGSPGRIRGVRTWLAVALIALLGASARAASSAAAGQFGCTYGGPLVAHVSIERSRGRYVASHFALWTQGGGRQLAFGEIRATGRAWLRVATSCSLRYSR
jgi:hypothetical protein